MPGSRGRTHLDAVDFVKTAAIVAVLMSHSGLYMLDPNLTRWDEVLTSTWNWHHVPAFLMVSGFLYFDAAPVRMQEITRPLLRVWIPYVLASLMMQLSGVANAKGPAEALYQIASASAIGAYYYIALVSFCIAALWPLSRLARGGAAVVLAALRGAISAPSRCRP